MKNNPWGTRRLIALISMCILAFVSVYSMVTGKDMPPSAHTIVTALIGYIGYYFGKSTALDGTDKERQTKQK
jgi:hypothetical protein